MDGQTFPFATFPCQSSLEDAVFLPQVLDGQFNLPGSYIDPSLQSPSLSEPYVDQWGPPQVKRWFSDDQNPTLFNVGSYSTMMTPVACHPLDTHPVPPPSQARFASPISSSDYPFTSPSPLADTESFYENNHPTTPSDSAALSPSLQAATLRYHNSEDRAVQFRNMGPAAPPAYVKPEDVDPSQQLGYCDAESILPEFTLEHRYSFESATSHNDAEQIQHQITVALETSRTSSPEEMRPIKVETGASSQYPPPPDHDDDDRDVSEVPAGNPASKRKTDDDDDGEYTPGKKPRSNATSSPRRTKAKPAPSRLAGDKSPKRKPAAPNSSPQSTPSRPWPSSSNKSKTFPCPHCKHTSFKDEQALESHVKKQHTRPFKCVFHFAGCNSTFASKNEWKRHNSTQHLVLHFWLCTEGPCGKNAAGSSTSSSSSSRSRPRGQALSSTSYNNTTTTTTTTTTNTFDTAPDAGHIPSPSHPHGTRFNRKDLYTQHVRRMHMPPHIKKDLKQLEQRQQHHQQHDGEQPAYRQKNKRGAAPQSPQELTKLAWEDQLKRRQETALQDRIILPSYMRCPARGCGAEFRGAEAWDQRMEHVAKHLESGDKGEVVFGGDGDPTLMEWAASPDVAVVKRDQNGWVLSNPLKRGGAAKKEKAVQVEDEDEEVVEGEIVVDDGERDAEGEEDDDA